MFRYVSFVYSVDRRTNDSVLHIFPPFQLFTNGPKIRIGHGIMVFDSFHRSFKQSVATVDELGLAVVEVKDVGLRKNSFRLETFSTYWMEDLDDVDEADPIALHSVVLLVAVKRCNYSFKMVQIVLTSTRSIR